MSTILVLMLKAIGKFLAHLFIFGLGYYAINLTIEIITGFMTVDHTLKPVAFFIWTIIPGIFLVKEAFALWAEVQEKRG